MSKIVFDMKVVEKKREGKFMKASIYDPMIDQFIESGNDLVEITVEGRKPAYIAHSLKKRIEKRDLPIIASAAGGFAYLEKKTSASA